MGNDFADLIEAGREMDQLDAGTLPGQPNSAPPAAPPATEPAPVAPTPEPAPTVAAPAAPAAPEPVVFPTTREEYDRIIGAPAAPVAPVAAPVPIVAPTPPPPGFPAEVPGQAVPYGRFDEVRRSAAQLKAENETLTRALLARGAPGPATPPPAANPAYNPQVAALVDPIMAERIAQAKVEMRNEMVQTYGLEKLAEEKGISEADALVPGYRAAHGQVVAYYETLPPDQQQRFSGVDGAIGLMAIMQARGMIQAAAPAAAAPAAPVPQYVGPAPVLAPSTARAHMEVRPGREAVMPASEQAAVAAVYNMSEAQFEAYLESLRNRGTPTSYEPDRLLR